VNEEQTQHVFQRVRAGDQDAAQEIFDRYFQRLIGLAHSRLSEKLGRKVDADDIVQSALRSFFVRSQEGQYAIERSGDLWKLLAVITRCRDTKTPIRVLGSGSNVLVRDEGVPGVVLRLDEPAFSEVRIEGTRVVAGGAAPLATVINDTVRAGLGGLDTLVGIPGVVGAALHQNAGGRGGDIGQWVSEATVVTRSGETITRSRDEMVFGYRESSLDELVVLEALGAQDRGVAERLEDAVLALGAVGRVQQPMREGAVVGEEQQPLGVGVEPAHRMETRQPGRQELHHGGATLRVAAGGERAPGLVQHPVGQGLEPEALPVHLHEDLVELGPRVVVGAQVDREEVLGGGAGGEEPPAHQQRHQPAQIVHRDSIPAPATALTPGGRTTTRRRGPPPRGRP